MASAFVAKVLVTARGALDMSLLGSLLLLQHDPQDVAASMSPWAPPPKAPRIDDGRYWIQVSGILLLSAFCMYVLTLHAGCPRSGMVAGGMARIAVGVALVAMVYHEVMPNIVALFGVVDVITGVLTLLTNKAWTLAWNMIVTSSLGVGFLTQPALVVKLMNQIFAEGCKTAKIQTCVGLSEPYRESPEWFYLAVALWSGVGEFHIFSGLYATHRSLRASAKVSICSMVAAAAVTFAGKFPESAGMALFAFNLVYGSLILFLVPKAKAGKGGDKIKSE